VPYCFVNVFGQNLTVQDQQDLYAWQLSHEIAEMTVDPGANQSNPEVCDACGPNCPPDWRDFFGGPANAYFQTTNAFPPGFAFNFFINAIVRPDSATQCPAPQSACFYAPPGFGNLLDGNHPIWIADFTGDGHAEVLFYYSGNGNWVLGNMGGRDAQLELGE
jgi:hypothetical protein